MIKFFTLVIISLSISLQSYAETVEVVVFNHKKGVAPDQVIQASRIMEGTLRAWPGFIRRELVQVGGRQWLDIVHWSTPEAAKQAQQKVMQSQACLTFFALLEEQDQLMLHGESVLVQQATGL